MIETHGLIGTVEAANAVMKATNVTLIGKRQVDGGLVTVMARGDVGVMETAADAGAAAVERIDGLLSVHVIPHPHTEIDAVLSYATTEL